MTTWFTSDTHFGHVRICQLEQRPFGEPILPDDPPEVQKAKAVKACGIMDEAIIENWNSYVKPGDIVRHQGDFAFHNPLQYLERLNGSIHLCLGNHDKLTQVQKSKFASCKGDDYIKLNGQKIHLYHYKCQVWRSNYRGTWHVHGHSHCQLKRHIECACPKCGHQFQHSIEGKYIDVGIMSKGWRIGIPWLWSFEEIAEFMKDKPSSRHHDMLEEE
jgi:calcineurin-like phosphoesterase family protein